MTDQLRDDSSSTTDPAAIRQSAEIDVDQVDDSDLALGAISTTPVDAGSSDIDPDRWAEQMADGEDFDESMGDATDDDRVLATDELDEIDDDDAPEGAEARDEEFEGDDPADIPDEHGGTQAGVDTDDNGVDDTTLPEGTDSIVDATDWE